MNMDNKSELPIYVKGAILIIGIFTFLTILYIGRSIIVPLIFAMIIAIVLHPVVNFFVRLKINRILAISITLLLAILLLVLLGALIISQVGRFTESWPFLVDKLTEILNSIITWASGYFEITPQKVQEYITKIQDKLINIGSNSIGKALQSIGSGLVTLLLIPIYVFMILFYHPYFNRICSPDI